MLAPALAPSWETTPSYLSRHSLRTHDRLNTGVGSTSHLVWERRQQHCWVSGWMQSFPWLGLRELEQYLLDSDKYREARIDRGGPPRRLHTRVQFTKVLDSENASAPDR
jgi:hypothetical protein